MDTATALPVEVDVDRRLHDELVAHLEGPLGWQVTVGDDLPPALRLTSVGARGAAGAGRPWGARVVLLVRDDDPSLAVASAARSADAVLGWPGQRDELPHVAAALSGAGGPRPPGAGRLSIGGAAGGVGTTTVTLAVGGLVAWRGRRCLVVCRGDVPVPDVPTVPPAALSGHRTWEVAAPVPGAPGLRAVATPPGPGGQVAVPDGTVVVHDLGVGADPDVLVVARDRAGHDAVLSAVSGVVVVVDRGPLPAAAFRRATPGRSRLDLPWSGRVARAGALRRVPTSLPGRWLHVLDPLARALTSNGSASS